MGATSLREELLEPNQQPFTLPDGSTVPLTLSGGLAACARTRLVGKDTLGDAYSAADRALYAAKAAGRARLETAKPAA